MSDDFIPRTEAEQLADALDALRHIIKACKASCTQTRRIRWIALRAADGINGTVHSQRTDLPKKAPESFESLHMEIVKLKAELSALRVRTK
jgi:hypothetical protein